MNFTREPIIETIITPKEGCKLSVRSSKSEGEEEYLVDAVEVVSFGRAMFFRHTEKPKPFLVPVGDYEVIETKETRVVLKNAQFERTIKIGGGREASIRREVPERVEEEEDELDHGNEETSESTASSEAPFDRKRGGQDRRRNRRRRASDERDEMRARLTPPSAAPASVPSVLKETPVKEESNEGAQEPAAAVFQGLLKPPTTLVSDNIEYYKKLLAPTEPAPTPPEEAEGKGQEEAVQKEEEREVKELNRVVGEIADSDGSHPNQPYFSNLNDWTNFLS